MTPQSELELAEQVATAKGPLRLEGGGSRAGLGHAVEGEALSVAGLTGVTLYEPGALTLVAKAGTPVAEVEATLAAEGQMLPFEPMSHGAIYGNNAAPTIGGMVAVNASGPRRIQAGACRDSLIGVRFVDGMGEVIKNGGRVMKNVTGYDLVKLMAGSHGTLGVMTELSFKVLPRPEVVTTLVVHGLSDVRAVEAMTSALTSPFDVTGAAHVAGRTMVRVEGLEGQAKYRVAQLTERLSGFGEITVEPDADWADIRDARSLSAEAGDIWRISVKPSDGPALGAALGAEALVYDWGGGLVWARVAARTDVRALMTMPGHATLMRGEGRVFHPQPEPLARIEAGLRAKFDPRRVLNAGVMG